MSRQSDTKELIQTHKRRLRILKQQKALQGISADPKIILEIQDIEEELRKLQANLGEDNGSSKSTILIFVGILSIVVTYYFLTFVFRPIPSNNHPPVIHSLTATKRTASPGETITITASATDEDGDPLAYIWSADQGIVPNDGPGPQIDYIAPEKAGVGIVTVEVTVTDGLNGVSKEKVTIAIQSND